MTREVEHLLPLVEPFFHAIRTLPTSGESVETVRTAFLDRAHDLRRDGARAGVGDQDLDDALYALVALADEAMLARPETRDAWLSRLLQMSLFGENTAGTGFYARLEALRRDLARGDVLLVYYLALALGFRGHFRAEDEPKRAELLAHLHGDLLRAGARTDVALAPSWRPRTAPARRGRESLWLLAAGGAAVLGAVVLWLLFDLDLVVHVAAFLRA